MVSRVYAEWLPDALGHSNGLIIVGAGADDHVADKTHQGPAKERRDGPWAMGSAGISDYKSNN